MIENALVTSSIDVELVSKQFYKSILKIPNDRIKSKALLELARAEHAISMGASPVIQYSAVLAVIWIGALGGA